MAETKRKKRTKRKKKHGLTAFGKEVKIQAIRQGVTLGDLAKESGTSRNYLYLIMYGERPRSRYIPLIAERLGLSARRYG